MADCFRTCMGDKSATLHEDMYFSTTSRAWGYDTKAPNQPPQATPGNNDPLKKQGWPTGWLVHVDSPSNSFRKKSVWILLVETNIFGDNHKGLVELVHHHMVHLMISLHMFFTLRWVWVNKCCYTSMPTKITKNSNVWTGIISIVYRRRQNGI